MLTNPLFLTLLIESSALFLLGEKKPIFYLYWAAATSITNVCANLYLNFADFESSVGFYFAIAVIEFLVFISEFFLCFLYTKDIQKSIKYSAICNLASYLIGSLILFII